MSSPNRRTPRAIHLQGIVPDSLLREMEVSEATLSEHLGKSTKTAYGGKVY
jgi:hypothetical protein